MDYRKMYYLLFNAMTDAINCLRQNNAGQAMQILIAAQQDAEELFIGQE